MKLNAILLICAIVIASSLVWYSSNNTSTTVPIIRADKSPIKERPNERGGMNIANKDSTIYNTIRQGSSQKRVENLLADNQSRKAVSREDLFAGLKSEQTAPTETSSEVKEVKQEEEKSLDSRFADSNKTEEAVIEAAPAPTPKVEPVLKKTETVSLTTTPKARPQAQIRTKTPLVKEARSEKKLSNLLAEVQGLKTTPIQKRSKPKVNTAKAGNNYIQIGSLKSEDAAKSHWSKRKKEFATALKNFSLRVQKIEIAGRGNFYRVQGGPVSKETAKQACATINKRHANSCIVK